MKAVISTPLLLAAAIALSACAVGPDYRAPDVAPAHMGETANCASHSPGSAPLVPFAMT